MAAALLIVGAFLVVAGAASVSWQAGLVAAGVLALAAGVDLRPRTP
jgi:hypothetical protein